MILIGASLSEPYHVRSTVKFDALPYMAKILFKCKPTLHQVHRVLTNITSNTWSANHNMGIIYHSSANHNLLTTMYE